MESAGETKPERVAIQARVWLEMPGGLQLGGGRVALLEQIDACSSISAAARACKMSYRRAWTLVHRMNETGDSALVATATGGAGGGGAKLTPAGRRAIHLYRRMEEALAVFQRETAEALSDEAAEGDES